MHATRRCAPRAAQRISHRPSPKSQRQFPRFRQSARVIFGFAQITADINRLINQRIRRIAGHTSLYGLGFKEHRLHSKADWGRHVVEDCQ